MTTQQPKWTCVANLGDVNPVDYGGAFVFVDTTGVYDPKLELLEPYQIDGKDGWEISLICCEQCYFENGILSDNPYHKDKPAWFWHEANRWHKAGLQDVCDNMGTDQAELIRLLCSQDPIERARGYLDIARYYGCDNFDSRPLDFTKRSKVTKRYRTAMNQLARMNRVAVRIREIKLNREGYDMRGNYYGMGRRLYRAISDDDNVDLDLVYRADNRQHARDIAKKRIAMRAYPVKYYVER